MRYLSLLVAVWLVGPSICAFGADTAAVLSTEALPPVKIDFLASYYQQDGDHSAVTGGEGTEALKDAAGIIRINVPLQPGKDLQIDTRISYFTSASSDNIDPRTISGASRTDYSLGSTFTVNREYREGSFRTSFSAGGTHEQHFMSLNGGYGMGGRSAGGEREWKLGAKYMLDIWAPWYSLEVLYPSDYYGTNDLDQKQRHTLQSYLGWQQVVNDRLQAAVSLDVIQQFGLLSTPFNRVYFHDQERIDIERFPDYRLRMPVSARLNHFSTDWLVMRWYYRFYWDNHGLKSHSLQLEAPVKLHRFLTFSPFYRFHVQYGHRYFKAKGEHSASDTYYTSDHDYSDLHSHYAGAGLRWVPFRKTGGSGKRWVFRAVELRSAWYTRSDGLRSWLVSAGVSASILQKTGPDREPFLP